MLAKLLLNSVTMSLAGSAAKLAVDAAFTPEQQKAIVDAGRSAATTGARVVVNLAENLAPETVGAMRQSFENAVKRATRKPGQGEVVEATVREVTEQPAVETTAKPAVKRTRKPAAKKAPAANK